MSNYILVCRWSNPSDRTLAVIKATFLLGVDAISKHIGISASTAKTELLASEVELCQNVTVLLADLTAIKKEALPPLPKDRVLCANNSMTVLLFSILIQPMAKHKITSKQFV